MYYIGVDLGGTNIAIGICDEERHIVLKDKVPTGAHRETDRIIEDMAGLCRDLVERTGISWDEIGYVGIAAPGTVDPAHGVVMYCNNIKMFHYPICDKLASLLPAPKKVYLENDANAAALAEAKVGAGAGKDDVIMITLGTGLGGGIVIDGKLYSGFNYAGAELGHMIIEHNGKHCTCGNDGCWEAYSSATGLIRMTKEKLAETKDTVMWDMVEGDIEKASARTAFNAAKQGDRAGKEVVDMYIDYLATGMINIVNIFQPEVFCIGGGVCGEGDYLLKPLTKIVDERQYGAASREIKTAIRIAELGNDAGIIGAALIGE
ncbi:MAG: ROK family protein [Clostridia bacterium]|nr:ROK family protein [Clostridia bacterium]